MTNGVSIASNYWKDRKEKHMTATEEKQMIRDIHKIAIALQQIAKSMNDTVLMVKSEPINDTDKGIKADAEALKYFEIESAT